MPMSVASGRWVTESAEGYSNKCYVGPLCAAPFHSNLDSCVDMGKGAYCTA